MPTEENVKYFKTPKFDNDEIADIIFDATTQNDANFREIKNEIISLTPNIIMPKLNIPQLLNPNTSMNDENNITNPLQTIQQENINNIVDDSFPKLNYYKDIKEFNEDYLAQMNMQNDFLEKIDDNTLTTSMDMNNNFLSIRKLLTGIRNGLGVTDKSNDLLPMMSSSNDETSAIVQYMGSDEEDDNLLMVLNISRSTKHLENIDDTFEKMFKLQKEQHRDIQLETTDDESGPKKDESENFLKQIAETFQHREKQEIASFANMVSGIPHMLLGNLATPLIIGTKALVTKALLPLATKALIPLLSVGGGIPAIVGGFAIGLTMLSNKLVSADVHVKNWNKDMSSYSETIDTFNDEFSKWNLEQRKSAMQLLEQHRLTSITLKNWKDKNQAELDSLKMLKQTGTLTAKQSERFTELTTKNKELETAVDSLRGSLSKIDEDLARNHVIQMHHLEAESKQFTDKLKNGEMLTEAEKERLIVLEAEKEKIRTQKDLAKAGVSVEEMPAVMEAISKIQDIKAIGLSESEENKLTQASYDIINEATTQWNDWFGDSRKEVDSMIGHLDKSQSILTKTGDAIIKKIEETNLPFEIWFNTLSADEKIMYEKKKQIEMRQLDLKRDEELQKRKQDKILETGYTGNNGLLDIGDPNNNTTNIFIQQSNENIPAHIQKIIRDSKTNAEIIPRADGGDISKPNQIYLTGEEGPELIQNEKVLSPSKSGNTSNDFQQSIEKAFKSALKENKTEINNENVEKLLLTLNTNITQMLKALLQKQEVGNINQIVDNKSIQNIAISNPSKKNRFAK